MPAMHRFLASLLALPGSVLAALPAAAQTGNSTHDSLAARSQTEQRLELHRLLHAAGQVCGHVSIIFFAGLDQARTAYWDARCREGLRYRVALTAHPLAPPGIVSCAGLVPAPAGGPCFQPLQAAGRALAAGTGPAGDCRSNCASQPAGPAPAASRFGVIYHAELPLGAFGFANGATDRLEVNLRTVRACQSQAGKVPCRFEAELVNSCGALAQAIRRGTNSLVMTGDLRTYMVVRASVGTGPTQTVAEQAALGLCRGAEGAGVACRVVASGC